MIKKLKALLDKILCKLRLKKCSKPCSDCGKKESKPKLEPKPAPKKPEPKPAEPEVEHARLEPPTSHPEKAKIQSFLWKPESDHAPHNPVIVVGCDALRSEDLHIEILNKNGNKVRMGVRNSGRANQLHPQKWGRIHFRLDRHSKKFKGAKPLTIILSTKVNGKKKILKKLKISDPTKRIDNKY